MTAAEALQALLGLCSAIVALGVAFAFLIPSEPIAPGMFGDHRAAVAQTRTLLPIWRPELDLDAEPIRLPDGTDVTFTGERPDAVVTVTAHLADGDADRLWALIRQHYRDPNRKA